MTGRAPLFPPGEELDLSDFDPQPARPGASPDEVRTVARHGGFKSREPAPAPVRQEPRRYRTGRNQQLNLKVRAADADAFYALADAQGWVLGDAFARAVAALQKEVERA